ncbi:MAG: hypothetical protein ACXW3D_08790 [Caulobacteraceae bacterium]
MRLRLFAAASIAACAIGSPALAQTPVGVPTARGGPTPPISARPGLLTDSEMKRRNALMGEGWQYRVAPPDAATLAAMRAAEGPPAADLSNIDLRIKADEITLTRMRDSELARENAVLLSLRPGFPYSNYDKRYVSIEPYLKELYRDIVSIPGRISLPDWPF